MKIIVGLGNIGEQYEKTRHNCGFIVVDEFIKELSKETTNEIIMEETPKFKALTCKTTFNNETLLLVKPTTLMNLSGLSVSKILSFYKESPDNLIVIYDDIDLPLGKIRFRETGSAGTHNGMKSIIQEIGSENFKRIRVGIESRGDLTPEKQDISSFVLSQFNEKEQKILKISIKEAIEQLKKLI
ncbi:MAG TPA: aminoacyl-tRNA hydrolase [Candidatus Portnoybacteria bacterium]|nr:aminoacyl-tRNA hydrolase [Candidatus Portnoybacteria bacterium]